MTRCGGNEYKECAICINRELDPSECEECEEAGNFEGGDETKDAEEVEWLTFHEFRNYMLKEAA